jgi:hypothetical protein
MPRPSRVTTRNPEPSYPAWKAEAVKALQGINPGTARATGERVWTRAYVKHLSPEKAAELAALEYDNTHRPAWTKRRR